LTASVSDLDFCCPKGEPKYHTFGGGSREDIMKASKAGNGDTGIRLSKSPSY